MPDTKISALGAAAALGGGELMPAVQGGGTVRVTPAQLLTYMLAQASTAETVQDIVGALVAAGTGIAVQYDDAGNTLTVASTAPKATVATADPTAGSDATQGYQAGSGWLNSASGVRWTCLDPSAGAASWYPLGALAHPGYVSGNSYPAQRTLGAALAVAIDTLYAIPLHLAQRVSVSALCLRITAAATGNVKLGLYANNPATARPGAKLAEGAAAGSTGIATTIQVALGANAVVGPGPCWLAAIFSATPTVNGIGAADQLVTSLLGHSNPATALSLNPSVTGVTGASSFASGLPATFGTATPTIGSSPLVGFTVA